MKSLLCSATTFEITPTIQWLQQHARKKNFSTFEYEGQEIQILVTGVGLVQATFSLTKMLQGERFDLMVQIGIGGSYRRDDELGSVVQVVEECFGDIGIQERDGSWSDLFQLGLVGPDQYPFKDGRLHLAAESPIHPALPHRRGITVAMVTGTDARRDTLWNALQPDIETMEGAAFFYTALMQHTPFIQLRGISNYVEARNRENWQLEAAIDGVNQAYLQWLRQE